MEQDFHYTYAASMGLRRFIQRYCVEEKLNKNQKEGIWKWCQQGWGWEVLDKRKVKESRRLEEKPGASLVPRKQMSSHSGLYEALAQTWVGRECSEDNEKMSGCVGRRKHRESLDHTMLGPKGYEQIYAYTSLVSEAWSQLTMPFL